MPNEHGPEWVCAKHSDSCAVLSGGLCDCGLASALSSRGRVSDLESALAAAQEALQESEAMVEWDRWLIAMLVATEYTQHTEGCPVPYGECVCWMTQVFTVAEARAALPKEADKSG